MDVAIERADREDIDLLVIRRLEFLRDVRGRLEAWEPEFIGATRRFTTVEFDAGRLHSWIARGDNGGCVGVVSLLLWARAPLPESTATCDAYVINMHVDAEHRGHGIGARLLDACRASRDELGIGRFRLQTTPDGRKLYESAGFVANPKVLEWTGD